MSEIEKEQATTYFQAKGADDPLRIDLAAGLDKLVWNYQPDVDEPRGLKFKLLRAGFPADQLARLVLPQGEFLSEWLSDMNHQAATSLTTPHDQFSDLQIQAYLQNQIEQEWAAKVHWTIMFLERFSPDARVTLIRVVGEHVAPVTDNTYNSPRVTPYMIKRFKLEASYNRKKYFWPATKKLASAPSEIYSANGDYLEWISVDHFSDYLFNNKACSNQALANEIDLLSEGLPKAVERGRSMNLPKGCDYVIDLLPLPTKRSIKELCRSSAVVFVGRVTQATPGLYRNQLDLANTLLTIEIKAWLRKPEGTPGKVYYLMNGYTQFSLGPYQVCSAQGRYQDIPLNRLVLAFIDTPPLGVSGSLLSVGPDALFLLDETDPSTKKWGHQEHIKLSALKSLLRKHPYNKNEPTIEYL